jgi:retinol dehydrogenase-12
LPFKTFMRRELGPRPKADARGRSHSCVRRNAAIQALEGSVIRGGMSTPPRVTLTCPRQAVRYDGASSHGVTHTLARALAPLNALGRLAHVSSLVLITGATSGIGAAAARALAARGCTVGVVGRDPRKVEDVLSSLPQRGEGFVADLSTMAATAALADEVIRRWERVDVLFNNAGVYHQRRMETADGFEATFAVNHLAPMRLTHALWGHLGPGARVVTTSSDAHKVGPMRWDDLMLRDCWDKQGFGAYGQSKLANVLFTRALARRMQPRGVTATCFHPGFVATGFARNNGGLADFVMKYLSPIFARSPEKGAETGVWAATAAEARELHGAYLYDCKVAPTSRHATSDADAERLWSESLRLLGLPEPE